MKNIKEDKGTFYPLVSIIIPVYNGSNFLSEAIDSALAQTYKKVEIIVVNDGSKDNGATEEIAKKYGDSIRYFHKENGGCASALNLGIREMRGEYFSWLSHDDLYENHKIEHQINTLRNLDNHHTIIYGGYKLIDHNSREYANVDPRNVLPQEKLNIALMPLLRGLIHGCALLIPAKLFHEIGVFDEKLLCTQDYALWFEFLSRYPIHFDNELLTRGREHPNKSSYIIPSVIDEGNELWSGFLKKLTIDQMIEMESSEYLFLKNTAIFLSNTPYQSAYKLAEELAQKALSKILVSVIIPFYNRINWTIEAIESVQAQTHQNFEILLINDGSTEDITDLQKLINKDNRIKYYSFDNNKGPSKARNLGIENASGDYITFLDSDDLFAPMKLEKQLKYMEEQQIMFSHTSYERINSNKEIIEYIDTSHADGMIFPLIIHYCPIATPTVMVNTKIMASYRFPQDIKIAEDICLWISLASNYLCGAINEPLTKVRITNHTTMLSRENRLKGILNILNHILNNEYYSKFRIQIRDLLYESYLLAKKEAIKGEPEIIYPKSQTTFLPYKPQKIKLALIFMFFKVLRHEGLVSAFSKMLLWIRLNFFRR